MESFHMQIRHRPSFLLSLSLLFIILSVVLAACGGGSNSNSAGSSTSSNGCKSSNSTPAALSNLFTTTQLASFNETYHYTARTTTTLKNVSIGLGYIPNIQFSGFTQVQALLTHRVDAVVGYSNNEPLQLRKQGLDVRTFDVSNYQPLISNGIVTT